MLIAFGGLATTALGAFYGHGGTVALVAVLALAAALAVATAAALEPAPRRQPSTHMREDEMPSRLRQIADILRESEHSAFSVDRSLRPLLVPIAAARLGRRGIDMTIAPGPAQELLGDRLWEIVGPDRTSAAPRRLAAEDLRAAIERLEQL